MTRKHFNTIAATIKNQRDFAVEGPSAGRCVETIDAIAFDLADQFKQFNPNFDKDRFIAACGVEAVPARA